MQFLSADCILPIASEPCYNSVLAIHEDGSVEGIISKNELSVQSVEINHYNGILCPGFVNTHCHLELSWAKGFIPEGAGLDNFVRQLEKIRNSFSETVIQQAIEQAAHEMEQSGIVAIADIANQIYTAELKSRSKLYFHTFAEVFGSNPIKAQTIFDKALELKTQFEGKSRKGKISIVPHSTYSVTEELFKLIAATGKGKPLSIHHQENEDENHFFEEGTGPISARRKAFNPELPPYKGTGKRPLESIANYFDYDQKLLLVHNTVTEQQDIDFAERYFKNLFWCLCPNANLYIEKRLPDVELFRKNGCKITLGTDSLASNHQLSIFEEIKTIQQHFPEVPLEELIRWGTLNGAHFLELTSEHGSFEKGKKPGVVLVENIDIPALKLNRLSTSRLLIPAGS